MFLHIFNVFVCVDNASTIDIRLAKTFDKSMYLVTLHVKYIDSRYIPTHLYTSSYLVYHNTLL